MAERHALRDGVPKHALKLPFRGASVRELAQRALEISSAGLQRRARKNRNGADESIFLAPLIEYADANQTPAERKLELFHGQWNGRSEEHTSELQSLMRISYAVFCLKKKQIQ